MHHPLEFNPNEDKLRLLISAINQKLEKVKQGGGKSRIEKEHSRGKMTARERIEFLLDEGSPQLEIGAFAGDGMYAEHGGCPSGGVVVIIGYIKGRQCIVVANDATVKAGAWFPMFTCRCRTKYLPIRSILDAFFEIMQKCLPWVSLRSRQLWEAAWQEGPTFQ